MNLMGGKWKIVILYQVKIMPKRYSELLKNTQGITAMTLRIPILDVIADWTFQITQRQKPEA